MTQNSSISRARLRSVTGASRGLGAAMALALADAGADVAVHASEKTPAATEASIKAKGRQAKAFVANLAKRDQGERLVPAVLEAFGQLDILVNNAGTVQRAPAAQHPNEMWDEIIAVNLTAVFLLSRAAGAHMIERESGGKIVNIASLLSFRGALRFPAMPRQGGVAQLTKALANEWAGRAHQRQRDCTRLHGYRQHERAARRSCTQPAD